MDASAKRRERITEMNNQPNQPSPHRRPSDAVLDELGVKDTPRSIDAHLGGCLAGYRFQEKHERRFGVAVYFALEAVWGIGRHHRHQATIGQVPESDRDAAWGLPPMSKVEVPWIWVCALAEAWERYK